MITSDGGRAGLQVAADAVRVRLRDAEQEVQKLREIVVALDALLPPSPASEPALVSSAAVTEPVRRSATASGTHNAAVALDALAQGHEIDARGLVSAAGDRGHVMTVAQARATLNYLKRTHRAESPSHGRFRAVSTNAESPASTGPSVVPSPTSEEGRTADVERLRDRYDHLPRWNDSHGRGAPSVEEG